MAEANFPNSAGGGRAGDETYPESHLFHEVSRWSETIKFYPYRIVIFNLPPGVEIIGSVSAPAYCLKSLDIFA